MTDPGVLQEANPHFGPVHLLSFAFIGGGLILISVAWKVLYEAQRRHGIRWRPPVPTLNSRGGARPP